MDRWHHDHLDTMERKVNFSTELFLEDFAYMSPKLLLIFAFISHWCDERNIDFVVTSMIRSPKYDAQLKAKSSTHSDGRAFDMSIRPFTYEEIQQLVEDVNKNFDHIGAISARDGKSRPIVVHKNHDGFGSHAHVQVRR